MANKPIKAKVVSSPAARKRAPAQPVTERQSPSLIRRPPIPSPPEVRPVAVQGAYADSVSVIPHTAAALHLMTARLGEADDEERPKVLVPFAEVRLAGSQLADGSQEDEPTSLFAANLPLENLAYILLDLTSDMRRICGEVATMSGDLAVDPARMAHVRYFVAHLERQARSARFILDNKYGTPEDAAQGEVRRSAE